MIGKRAITQSNNGRANEKSVSPSQTLPTVTVAHFVKLTVKLQ